MRPWTSNLGHMRSADSGRKVGRLGPCSQPFCAACAAVGLSLGSSASRSATYPHHQLSKHRQTDRQTEVGGKRERGRD
jgi:hypothetical protein